VNRLGLNEEEAKVNSSKENLKHTKWECKYHVVFIPKYRRKVMYGQTKRKYASTSESKTKRIVGSIN
jgi:putative transposase